MTFDISLYHGNTFMYVCMCNSYSNNEMKITKGEHDKKSLR